MKTSITSTLFALVVLSAGCSERTKNISGAEAETVQYGSPLPDFYSMPVASSEIISLGGDEIVPPNSIVVSHNDDIFIADTRSNRGIFRFSGTGDLKNKIGGYGRGEGEYLNISGLQIQGDRICVFSSNNKEELSYSLDGKYLDSRSIPYAFQGAWVAGKNTWVYLGHGNVEYDERLMETDANGDMVSGWLSENKMLVPFAEETPVFSEWNGNILFRETFNNSVYGIDGNVPSVRYSFDLLNNNLPKDLFESDDPVLQFGKFLSKPTAIIKRVNENDRYIVAEFFVNAPAPEDVEFLYAIKNKDNDEWNWIRIPDMGDAFFGSYRYLTDNSELLFLLEPHQLAKLDTAKLSGLSENDLVRNENDNNVILKIRLQ